MRSIFGLILTAFWGTLIVISLLSYVVFSYAYQWAYERSASEHTQRCADITSTIEQALREDDIERVARILSGLAPAMASQYRIKNAQGQLLTPTPNSRWRRGDNPRRHRPPLPLERYHVTSEQGAYYQIEVRHRPVVPVWLDKGLLGISIRWGIGLVVGFMIAWLVAYSITRRLRGIQQVAHSVASGDYQRRVSAEGLYRNDEIGALAQDIDAMTEALSNNIKEKQTLLQNIAHELRAPLARQSVLAELLQRDKNNPQKIIAHSLRLEKDVAQLEQLTSHVLTLFRQQGQLELDLDNIALAPLLSEIIEEARFEFPALDFTLNGVECVVRANAVMLKSALENIIRNGAMYGQSKVGVSAQKQQDSVKIAIVDNGQGIAEEQLQEIFKPFARLDSARTPKQSGGYGLGLAISQAVIKNHGGQITADNLASGGLRVVVELPLA